MSAAVFRYLLIALLIAAFPAAAQKGKKQEKKETEDKPKMTRLVAQLVTHGAMGETAAKPKTLYRFGTTHARVEEEPDPGQSVHRLIVTAVPDTWVINLFTRTGQRYVDPGPEFKTALPIFWGLDGKPDKDFEALEFANEMEFFRAGRAREAGTRTVDGKQCKVLSLKTGEHEAILFLEAKRDRPLRIDLIKYGRLTASVRYVSYEPNLPFDAALFVPPKDVTIAEEIKSL
jgi:hypothetical protein